MTVTTAAALPVQLAVVKEEMLHTRERARRLCQDISAGRWSTRPAPDQWAIGECLTHLNITSERFIPLLDDAIRDGRARKIERGGPYGKGLIGWALAKFLEPPYKMKTQTPSSFLPVRVDSMPETLERFDYLQQELQQRIDRAAGLAVDKIKLVSPFDGRVKYNLYATFCIITAHQRRHLWQAEQVLAQLNPTA